MTEKQGEPGERESAPLPATRPAELLDPTTGELLPATPENAAGLLKVLRGLRGQINEAVRVCSEIIIEESMRQGTKTLALGGVTAKISGGSEIAWDVEMLLEGLRRVGCPEYRLDALVQATIEYKVNQTVARQLAAANPRYAEAIEAAKARVPAPTRVSV